jgi:hypothetical protein
VSEESRDTSGVPVPPPLFFVAGLLVGCGVEQPLPIDGAPDAFRVAACAIGGTIWLVLDGAAMLRFSPGGNEHDPLQSHDRSGDKRALPLHA